MNIEALRQEAEQKITEAIAEFSAKANVEVTMYYDGLRYNRLPGADLMTPRRSGPLLRVR